MNKPPVEQLREALAGALHVLELLAANRNGDLMSNVETRHGSFVNVIDTILDCRAALSTAPAAPEALPEQPAAQERAEPAWISAQLRAFEAVWRRGDASLSGSGAISHLLLQAADALTSAWKSGDEDWADVILQLCRQVIADPTETRWTALRAAIRSAAPEQPTLRAEAPPVVTQFPNQPRKG